MAIALAKSGSSWADIMAITGIARQTLARVLSAVSALPAATPPAIPTRKAGTGFGNRKVTPAMKTVMRRALSNTPMMSAKKLKETNRCLASLAVRTIQDVLKREMGLPSRHAAKKPLLTNRMLDKRLAFANRYKNWEVEDWKTVMFSDESHFEIFRTNKFARVRRPVGSDRFDP